MKTQLTPFDSIPAGIAFKARAISERDGQKIERTYDLSRDTSNGKQIVATACGVKEADVEAILGDIFDTRTAAVRFLDGEDKRAILDLIQFAKDARTFGLTNPSLDTEDIGAIAKLDVVEDEIREAISAQM